ncbi:neuromedin U [Synechococcus sp. A10-1-5-9]|uniref:neuromedin U n=1 Tax=Synechococcus sp. A10-1-5-9 TaxID=3392295 RepID=UPI0039EAED1D
MTTLKFKILSSLFIALLGSSQGFSARAQVSDQPLVADPADFDFTPLLWTEATIAQSGSDQPQPVTGNEPVSVTPGESKAKEEGSLAKAAQNPIASLISLPIQWNSTPSTQWAPNVTIPSADPSLPPVRTNFKANQTQNVVNVQPVIPFKVSDGLTLVTRTIVPFISQPGPRGTSIQSLGDINPSVFFVPTLKGNFTVGVGPTVVIPSATDNRLSSKRWSAGPTGVLVYTKGPIVAGGLINNIWSFAGDDGRDVNKMLIQPFLNYNLPKGWYLTSSPIIAANWNQAENKGWTVPVGAGFGRVFVLGTQPVNASLSAYYNAVKPEVAGQTLIGDWTFRAQVQFLFPTGG